MELNRRETLGLLDASGAAMMLPEAARTIGWSGGFGTKWQSDPAKRLTTILLTQRMFDGPKPVAIFNRFEQDARALAG